MSFWTKVPFSLEWCCCRCKEYFSRAVTRVFLCFQPCCCNVFNWELKVITTLDLSISLYDWSRKLASPSQPISCKNSNQSRLNLSHFPRFRRLVCFYFWVFIVCLRKFPMLWSAVVMAFSRDALFDVGDWSKSNWLFFLLICSLQRRGTWTRRSIFKVNSSFCFTPLQSYVASLR